MSESEDEEMPMPSTSRQAKAKNKKKNGDDPTIKGKIHSVKVVDFVTYDSVTFTPGKYLNIIIGPNGTGKSTLVAAIILGMGGSPKVLSRSTNIQDYVKNGKEMAEIYIKLYNRNSKNLIKLGRQFDINGHNKWEIDDHTVTQKKFLDTVADYNIQIDNLCQFLPQDRVQDFTKMNPQELLNNTQSSVCAPEIDEALQKLKELRLQQKNSSKKLEDNKKMLVEQEKRNEGLQQQIENIQQKQKLDKDLDICKKKMAWMEFEELFLKYNETADDLKKAKENEKRAENAMRPLVDRSKQFDNLKQAYETKIKQKTTEYTKYQNELETSDESTDLLHRKLREAKADLEAIKTSADERDREIQQSEQVQIALMRDVKDAIASAGSEKDKQGILQEIDMKQNECKAKNMELLEKRRAINKVLEEKLKPELVATSQRITALENTAAMKLEILRSKFDHAFRGVLWLRNNLHLFSGKVYEPMILELNVKDSNHAKYFENLIAMRDLIAFTCERKEDVNLLGRKLRNEQHLNVNILHSEAAQSVTFRPQIPINQIRNYGFQSYMLDLIEGPAPILNILCRMNRIHNIPIGNQQSYDMSEQMPKEISFFFTPNHRISITTSRYTGEKSSSCIEINGRQLLSIGVDTAVLLQHEEKLKTIVKNTDKCKNERTRLEDEMRKIEEKNSDLSAERQRIIVKFNSVDSCKEKLKRHINRMENLKKNTIDVNEATNKFEYKAKKILEEILRQQRTKVLAYEKYESAKFSSEFEREKFRIFKLSNVDLENQIREHREAVEKAKTYVTKITKVLEDYKKKCKDKQSEAARLTDGKKPSDGNKFPYRTQFEALPADMEELASHMQELQGRIDCMGAEDTNIIEEYEQRKQQIETLKDLIANSSSDTGRLESQMEEIHDTWFTSISETVATVNNYFSTFMSSMSFSGEVELVHTQNLRDYDQYGIQIRVKYRNEEKLQPLDRFIQSGGERAVAIAVYTLSMQHISHVPFRCVDEINQGMDPRNERKIFDMLVDQTSQEGKSQYFFVTPKLLPNLKYNDLIAVHIVHNGKFITNREMFEF